MGWGTDAIRLSEKLFWRSTPAASAYKFFIRACKNRNINMHFDECYSLLTGLTFSSAAIFRLFSGSLSHTLHVLHGLIADFVAFYQILLILI